MARYIDTALWTRQTAQAPLVEGGDEDYEEIEI
jgi:hypothetical protein